MRRSATLLAMAACLLLAACGGTEDAPPARAPTPLDESTTGTVSGAVRFVGTVPAMQEINFGSFAECAAAHDGPVFVGDLLVHDGAVENAIVWVKSGLEDRVFAVPDTPVEIDQHGCLYVPRVVGVRVGQPVLFHNSDRALHNVHGKPEASSGWNFALPRPGSERTMRIDHAEVPISVRCDLHPWMQAWIGAFEHPYFAVTDADGRFSLERMPPGTYVIAAWHERLGTREAAVTLGPRGAEVVDLVLEARS